MCELRLRFRSTRRVAWGVWVRARLRAATFICYYHTCYLAYATRVKSTFVWKVRSSP